MRPKLDCKHESRSVVCGKLKQPSFRVIARRIGQFWRQLFHAEIGCAHRGNGEPDDSSELTHEAQSEKHRSAHSAMCAKMLCDSGNILLSPASRFIGEQEKE